MPAGRPSKYKPEFPEQARKLCELGATLEQIADFFEVHIATVCRWQVEYPEFCEALKAGRDKLDGMVEQSLYRRARGYEHDAVDIRVVGGIVVQTPIRKHYPPDTTACIFWLKNRQPAKWRDVEADPNSLPPLKDLDPSV